MLKYAAVLQDQDWEVLFQMLLWTSDMTDQIIFHGKCLALNKMRYFHWHTLQPFIFYSLCSLEGEVSGLFLQSSVCTGAAGVRDSGYDSLGRRISVLDRLTHTHPVWLLLPLNDEEAKRILQPQPPGVSILYTPCIVYGHIYIKITHHTHQLGCNLRSWPENMICNLSVQFSSVQSR